MRPLESQAHTLRASQAQAHQQIEDGDGRGARARHHQLHLADVLADELQAIADRRRRDDGRAVLVVVEHRDVQRAR